MIIETLPLAALRPHPGNYKRHPEGQVDEIAASIREHGVYRPVVVARDGTILAGHGVLEACRSLGMVEVDVVRLPIAADSVAAAKVIVADNELPRLGENDNMALAALLIQIQAAGALEGTGLDDAGVASILAMTQVNDDFLGVGADAVDAVAREWGGMPECMSEDAPPYRTLTVHFEGEAGVRDFADKLAIVLTPLTKIIWHPRREREHMADASYEAT